MKKLALVKRCLVSSLIIVASLFLLDPYFTFSNSLIFCWIDWVFWAVCPIKAICPIK